MNNYKIVDGKGVLEITRKDGTVVSFLIDVEDIELCKKYKWHVSAIKDKIYCGTWLDDGSHKFLHQLLLSPPDGKVVDHIDGDEKNNQKSNLRIATQQENARNLKKHRSKTGVIGVTQDMRCKNSFLARIYFSSTKSIQKTYRDKELAILQRLSWELMYFQDYAPQMELIKKDYPFLLNYLQVKSSMVINENIEVVRDIGASLKLDPHCPCMRKKDKNTICPCLPCRNTRHCCCGMFLPIEEDNNRFKAKYPDLYEEWKQKLISL